MPYVFQILAQLLELQTGEVSAAYLALLKPIMAPVLWEQSGALGFFPDFVHLAHVRRLTPVSPCGNPT